jgi:hypothetical protein
MKKILILEGKMTYSFSNISNMGCKLCFSIEYDLNGTIKLYMTLFEFSAARIIAFFSKLYWDICVAFECSHSWFNFKQHSFALYFSKWHIDEEHPTYGGIGGDPFMYLFKCINKTFTNKTFRYIFYASRVLQFNCIAIFYIRYLQEFLIYFF